MPHAKSSVYRFYQEALEFEPNSIITITGLFEEYCRWCELVGVMPARPQRFSQELGQCAVLKFKWAGRVRVFGVRVSLPSASLGRQSSGPRQAISDVVAFYQDRIKCGDGYSVPALVLFEAFAEWCERNGKEPIPLVEFSREFSELGVQKFKIAGRIRYIGIALN